MVKNSWQDNRAQYHLRLQARLEYTPKKQNPNSLTDLRRYMLGSIKNNSKFYAKQFCTNRLQPSTNASTSN